jgi:hypothetical protein
MYPFLNNLYTDQKYLPGSTLSVHFPIVLKKHLHFASPLFILIFVFNFDQGLSHQKKRGGWG